MQPFEQRNCLCFIRLRGHPKTFAEEETYVILELLEAKTCNHSEILYPPKRLFQNI